MEQSKEMGHQLPIRYIPAPILRQLDVNTFKDDPDSAISIPEKHYLPTRSISVFGGQLIGHTILVAHATVSDGLSIHSFHGSFIDKSGSPFPVRVLHNKLVFIAMMSFHRLEENPSLKFTRSIPADFPKIRLMEPVKRSDYDLSIANDGLKHNDEVLLAALEAKHLIPRTAKASSDTLKLDNLLKEAPTLPITGIGKASQIIQKLVHWERLANLTPLPSSVDSKVVWQYIRVNGVLPSSPKYGAAAFGMVSDAFSSQLPAVVLPHKDLAWITSLDHVMYFHRPFDPTKWLAVENVVSVADAGRSVVEMRYWNEDGELVATVLQEEAKIEALSATLW
ncbi:Acyl-coenzyme A thioesterase [Drechslerella dactyloides]|uniref:Acyl-coenzyme A thioesterase n=1 Tax=Drechslerella dactyloides TaxID=74499 RepID=A0AAD6J3Z9_DREDA|nr:Acyl-coenzyme A thioesterase [Drechslerella dactyloides]